MVSTHPPTFKSFRLFIILQAVCQKHQSQLVPPNIIIIIIIIINIIVVVVVVVNAVDIVVAAACFGFCCYLLEIISLLSNYGY